MFTHKVNEYKQKKKIIEQCMLKRKRFTISKLLLSELLILQLNFSNKLTITS